MADAPTSTIEIALVGGSGLSELPIENATPLEVVHTPWGEVPGIITGTLGGKRVGFVPRHGAGHTTPPHRLEARGYLWALRRLGASVLISTNAVGGVRGQVPVGSFALTTQLIDRTHGRADTFFSGTDVQHLSFAEPYDRVLWEHLRTALVDIGESVPDEATSVVIQGPRFSTRAEARWHEQMGAVLVNMTQMPEAALAAELGFAHVNLAFVTDSDAEGEPVTAEMVFRVMREAQPRMRAAVAAMVAAVPAGYAIEPRISAESLAGLLRMGVSA